MVRAARFFRVQKKPPLDNQGWCLHFASESYMKTNPPPVPCVPVSTSETHLASVHINDDAIYGMTLSEKAAIKHLIKNCGWVTLEPGVIRRPWKGTSK